MAGWPVILNNLTDPADVALLLTRAPTGWYLITSRRASCWHATAVAPVRLDVLDPAEALLRAILALDGPGEAHGAARLSKELDFLPRPLSRPAPTWPRPTPPRGAYLDLLAPMYQAAAAGGDAVRTIAQLSTLA